MNIRPKRRFQEQKDLAKKHFDWCAAEDTHKIIEAALSEYAVALPVATNPNQSVDYHQRLAGAKDFIEVLLNLSEPPTERQRLRSDHLSPPPRSKE